jgi:hypothetical protein
VVFARTGLCPAGRCGLRASKAFFFEKKKQKTFMSSRLGNGERSATAIKSFLVLFFKKEHSFFLHSIEIAALRRAIGGGPPAPQAWGVAARCPECG